MPTHQMARPVASQKFVTSPFSVMKRPTGYRASSPGPSSSAGSSMARPSSAVPKAGGKSLSGKDLSTYRTLQTHDRLKDTRCAPAFVAKLRTLQTRYEDRMRIASLESTTAIKILGMATKNSKRSIAQTLAKTKLAGGKAAAYVWAGKCMRGAVPAGVKEGEEVAPASWTELPEIIVDAVTAPEVEVEEDIPLDFPMTVPSVDQDEIDAAAQAEAAKKRNMMILYAVLGLGAAGAVFFLVRRRTA